MLAKPGTTTLYGFAAENIGSFKYNGLAVPLAPGVSNDTFADADAHALGLSRSAINTDGFAVHVFEV